MSCAIQVESLKKSYGSRTVLKDVSFCVEQGEIFALLGVNGAGKTTVLECVEGLRRYDGGRVFINGRRGVQLQSATLPAHIRPMEAVKLFAKWRKALVDQEMLEALEIPQMGKKQYGQLSTGQKRRLYLALALTGDPDILFLDEPTAGLDVEGRRSLHGQIRALQARGKTIVLASHDMAEVESLCSRIGILNGGVVSFCGTVAQLTQKVGRQYTIRAVTGQGEERLEVENVEEALLALLQKYQRQDEAILDLSVSRGTLEQHFIKLAGRRAQ